MKRLILISLLLVTAAHSGCCWVGCVTKRRNEQCCPTDIRKMHTWCWGEDAIFHSPCGPTEEFYGARPTVWREWPTSGANWRDIYGGAAPAAMPSFTPQVPSNPALPPAVPMPALPSAPVLQQPVMDSAQSALRLPPSEALPGSSTAPRPAQFLYPEFGGKSEFEL